VIAIAIAIRSLANNAENNTMIHDQRN